MAFEQVYINNTSAFFPNEPVGNEEMETYLGYINGAPSKSKSIVLRNNGIKRRFYALDKNGNPTHTNAGMTAEAIKLLFKDYPENIKDIDLLSCGTSSPDQLMPSHAVMTHGCLPESNGMEVVSSSGVCCSGMHALKYAYMSVKTGDAQKAVATGSERSSAILVSRTYEDEVQKLIRLEADPYISFEKDFLRWMLSDGASAFLLSNSKNETGISLRIEWIEGISYANELEPCMYMGSEKLPDGSLKSYLDFSPQEMLERSVLSVKQDVNLLGTHIIRLGGLGLKDVLQKHNIGPDKVDYFLPHMSSNFFREKIYNGLIENNMHIPYEKWFVNLSKVGNVGAASPYLMVNELFHSKRLKAGDTLLLLVPESSRFSYIYALLTVVD